MKNQKVGKIRLERRRVGMTQDELAKKIGVTTNFISLIERGKRNPSFKTLTKMSKALKVPRGQLLEAEQAFQEIKELNKRYNLEQIIEGLLKIVKEQPPQV